MTTIATDPSTLVSRDVLESRNPATGELIAEHPVHDASSVAVAVEKAREAASVWAELGFRERRRHLLRWVSHLVSREQEITQLIKSENGKPLDDAYLELMLAIEHISWAAKNAERVLAPRSVRPGLLMANFHATVEERPFGVVGVIGPWNYPIYTPTGSIAYALAAGNAVVFKPSEHTPTVGTWFAHSFAEANPDLPEGVLTAVTGYGAAGEALVRSGVDKIAFTGSTATGRKIMAAAAESLTPVILECGGKDAAIVADDADVEAAAEAIAWGAMANGGQTCVGVERVYVHREVCDRFLAEVGRILEDVRPGSDADASYGPMTVASQAEIVKSHLDAALASGGRLIAGGPESFQAPFVAPLVVLDADEACAAVTEETFGPIITVRAVESVDEAVALVNASQYGLASTVFSRRHGVEIARRLRVGATSVNSTLAFAAISSLPFGGVGASGFGRIHGDPGLREFTRSHAIAAQRFAIPGMALLSFARTRRTMNLVKKTVSVLHGRHS